MNLTPREDFESLIELLNMSGEEFDTLVSEIEKIPNNISFGDVEESLMEVTNSHKVILGLYFTFCKVDIPEKKFAKKLLDYYTKQLDEGIKKSDLESKVLKLFKKDNPVRLAIKSRIIASQIDKSFIDSRIITDIRPVFSSSEENILIGKVITNNLKISFRKDNAIKDVYFSLDEEDLESLKKTINRALLKTKLLKTKNLE
nr:hypothetical protein [Bacteroidota bacterium]